MVPLRLCSTSLPQDQTIVQRSRQFHFKGACVGLTNLTTLGRPSLLGQSHVPQDILMLSQGSEDPCVPPVSTNPQGHRAKRSLLSAHLCRGYSAK
ncbi:hypothetical protein E2C01_000087 [Portunus trituberculatus]|uniref:Uncharacterized protein n=1 Tax=Portunus trituberculatus TaxID=210409 RepID=A0A5B7CDZ0_PORTR|nr:hypothetical protein [Portunus trituberculatus]